MNETNETIFIEAIYFTNKQKNMNDYISKSHLKRSRVVIYEKYNFCSNEKHAHS